MRTLHKNLTSILLSACSDANGIETNHLLNGFWQVFILDGSSYTKVFQFVVKEVDGVVRLLLTELF